MLKMTSMISKMQSKKSKSATKKNIWTSNNAYMTRLLNASKGWLITSLICLTQLMNKTITFSPLSKKRLTLKDRYVTTPRLKKKSPTQKQDWPTYAETHPARMTKKSFSWKKNCAICVSHIRTLWLIKALKNWPAQTKRPRSRERSKSKLRRHS